MELVQPVLVASLSMFVALDCIGILPMFLGMTASLSDEGRKKITNTSMVVAFLVALGFTLVGQFLFSWLSITLPDFKVAGGLVLLLIALADLLGGPRLMNQNMSGSTGIVPIAVPLITGPAVLTQSIVLTAQHGYVVVFVALILNYVLAWGVFRKSNAITKIIGHDGNLVISKLAALLLAAIAVGMIRSGIEAVIRSSV